MIKSHPLAGHLLQDYFFLKEGQKNLTAQSYQALTHSKS